MLLKVGWSQRRGTYTDVFFKQKRNKTGKKFNNLSSHKDVGTCWLDCHHLMVLENADNGNDMPKVGESRRTRNDEGGHLGS